MPQPFRHNLHVTFISGGIFSIAESLQNGNSEAILEKVATFYCSAEVRKVVVPRFADFTLGTLFSPIQNDSDAKIHLLKLPDVSKRQPERS